jgi:hypothetical protein
MSQEAPVTAAAPSRRWHAASARRCAIVATLVATGLLASSGAAAQRSQLTAAPQIARAYDAIFDARFDEVPGLLDASCEGRQAAPAARRGRATAAASGGRGTRAPGEVCQLLEVVALWGRMQLDVHDTSRDAAFGAAVDAAIEAVKAWTMREPHAAEAFFYLGGAYGARAQWLALRGERLAAARDGKRIQEALERALALDPALQDAYFGIGLYRYYADVAPAAAKVLRWLLLLPGGDRAGGLEDMLRARRGGQLLRSEADYQLHLIYLWYEEQPQRALELLRQLETAHPHNPRFPQLAAEVEDVYLHDASASLLTWQRLLDRAVRRTVAEPPMTEVRARLGIARQLDRLFETDLAIAELRTVLASNPVAPTGAAGQAHLQLAEALDRLGEREPATAEYRAALASVVPGDPLGLGERVRAAMRRRPATDAAIAYRLSLEGWRALERGALADAHRALSASLARRPDDPVTRYRMARLLDAQRSEVEALDLLEQVIGGGASTPPLFYAAALFDAARLYERQGALPRAIELYARARAAEGASAHTKRAADHALARLAPPRE